MTHVSICQFDTTTGRIIQTGFCDRTALTLQVREGCTTIEGVADLNTDYVDVTGVPTITSRPTFPTFDQTAIRADDTDAATLVFTAPFALTIDGTAYAVDQPNDLGQYEVRIKTAMPATYVVEINHWPYRPYRAEIVAS